MSKKFLGIILAGIMAAVICCGCDNTPAAVQPPAPKPPNAFPYKEADETDYVFPALETYRNNMELTGQWGQNSLTGKYEYGTGDPFVMRHNGKYYLYPSTLDRESGIKVFVSSDMVNWRYEGFAVSPEEETTRGAYAPEVVYYNGAFYMCQSKGGSGHYIYKSDSPTAGFELISGNIGLGIDGAFHIDDDGELYILHTGGDCIEYTRVADIENASASLVTRRLDAANLGGWVEGPGIIRRGAYSYLTYTGNHVLSKGYRVAYAYAKDLSDLNDFVQPEDNITLISTKENFSGLGHSSNFYGPDLDSIYTAYHNLVGFDGPPSRHYNLDRYVTNGSRLSANGVTDYEVNLPAAPDFEDEGDGLVSEGEFNLSETGSEDVFTAEINFRFADVQKEAKVVCAYRDGDNYCEIAVSPADNAIVLTGVTDGNRSELARAALRKNNNYGRLNTVRTESGAGRSYVYYNGMRALTVEGGLGGGKIGGGENAVCEYSAFTNDAFGTSDFEAVKNLPSSFPAVHYLKGENRGFKLKSAAVKQGGARQGEKESTSDAGGRCALKLTDKGDWVKYALNVSEGGDYAVWAEVSAESAGAVLEFITNNKTLTALTLPAVPDGKGYAKAYLGVLPLDAGRSTLKVRLREGSAEIIDFTFNAGCSQGETISEQLNGKPDNFVDFSNNFTYSAQGATGPSTGEGMLLCGAEGNADYAFSCDVSLKSGTQSGLVFRTKNFSVSRHDTREGRMQAYFLRIFPDGAELIKYNYSKKVIGRAVTLKENGTGLFFSGRTNRVSVTLNGGQIIVEINGKKIFDVYDAAAFTGGKAGVYCKNGSIAISDLEYECF